MLSLLFIALMAATPEPARATLMHVRAAGALECPDETTFKEGVTARLGFDPFVPSAPLRLVTQIEKTAKGYSGSLQLLKEGSPQRSRAFTGSTCEAVTDSLLLAVTLAIDPQVMTRPLHPPAPVSVVEPPPIVAPPVPPAPAPVIIVAPPVVEPPPVPVQVRFALALRGSYGLTPGVAPGGAIAVGFRRGVFELWAEGTADLSNEMVVVGGSVTMQPFAGTLLPCFASSIGFTACVQVGAGALRVHGNLLGGANDIRPLALAGARLSYELLSRFGLGASLRASVLAVPTQVTVLASDQPVWTTAPVMAELSLAVTGLL